MKKTRPSGISKQQLDEIRFDITYELIKRDMPKEYILAGVAAALEYMKNKKVSKEEAIKFVTMWIGYATTDPK